MIDNDGKVLKTMKGRNSWTMIETYILKLPDWDMVLQDNVPWELYNINTQPHELKASASSLTLTFLHG